MGVFHVGRCAMVVASMVVVGTASGQTGIGLAMSAAARPQTGKTLGSQTPEPTTEWPHKEGRLFGVRSKQAWATIQERLKELGLSAAKTDRENQLLITKWCDFGSDRTRWLHDPPLPEQYGAKRARGSVRFEVFVSPFVEPARVYVGSQVELRNMTVTSTTATAYNVPNVNEALIAEIAKVLGQEGFPIPSSLAERNQLALSILKDQADECLRGQSACDGKSLLAPKKIALSEFETLFPGEARREETGGQVRIECTLNEDGAVVEVHLLGRPVGHQFEASAMGTTSLLVFSPLTRCGCPMPAVVTQTFTYGFTRH
jgi:TonB family protein